MSDSDQQMQGKPILGWSAFASNAERVLTRAFAEAEDLRRQLTERDAYIQRLEEHIKALGSEPPERPA